MDNHLDIHLHNVVLVNGKRVYVSNPSVLNNILEASPVHISGVPLNDDELHRIGITLRAVALGYSVYKIPAHLNFPKHLELCKTPEGRYQIVSLLSSDKLSVSTDIKYVHRLQNIVAALCGTLLKA